MKAEIRTRKMLRGVKELSILLIQFNTSLIQTEGFHSIFVY